jgi:hypothetical protein
MFATIHDMKTPKIVRSTVVTAAVAVAALVFAGCASTAPDRAASMSKDVIQSGKNLEASRQAVSQCLTTLNQLISQPSGDMRGQYKDYLASVKSLGKISDRVDVSINKMMDASHIYFADWDNSISAINDPTLKQLSQDRKQQAVSALADLKKSIDQVRTAYKPLAKDLDDIGLYLGNNLTTDGIAAMKSRLETVKVEALGVRDSISSSVTALNKYSATLATAK